MPTTPISVTFTGELNVPAVHGPAPASVTFTGEPRPATGVLADDDSWQNTTGRFVLVYVDKTTLVVRDAAAYAAAWGGGTIIDESYYATVGTGIGLALVPPDFHLVIDARPSDTYPGVLL